MHSHAEIKPQLLAIQTEILAASNPYGLQENEREDVRITVQTLAYLIDNLERLKNINNVWPPEGGLREVAVGLGFSSDL
jgi:hypothetical protein